MLCERPFLKGVLELGCGRCESCSINRSRLWVGRMLLEALEHEFSAFVTLTYDQEHHPWDGNLRKKDLQLFMKRLRLKVSPRLIRFYGVGEYGSETLRPHYHLILFGISPLESTTIQECWPNGYIFCGTVEEKSCSYVAQYVTKKMWHKKDPRLKGKTPEFQLMSLRPGIGHGVVERLVKAHERYPMVDPLKLTQLRMLGAKYPIGSYLRNKFYVRVGVTKEQKQENVRALNREKYDNRAGIPTATYWTQRRARIVAALGRRAIERKKAL